MLLLDPPQVMRDRLIVIDNVLSGSSFAAGFPLKPPAAVRVSLLVVYGPVLAGGPQGGTQAYRQEDSVLAAAALSVCRFIKS